MNVNLLFCLSFLFLLASSLDTLSNYQDINLVELTGIFEPDFKNKIVKGDLIYNFKSKINSNQIILDSKNLNVISVSNINNSKSYNFKYGEEGKNNSETLIIDYEYKENETIILNIKYETTPRGKSAFFMNKNLTLGKSHDYFYAISSLAHGRELLPIQDTPAIKFPFNLGIKVDKDISGMISGLLEKEEENEDGTKTIFFHQNIPVPNYLINLAAGNFCEMQINENISIYSETEVIYDAYNIFKDILPKILDEAISYIGPYEWGKFNLLFLPQFFPFSVLEGSCLYFCSPFLLDGDQTSIDLIVGEVVSSWAGNLVTHDNWSDLWISKGLKKFLQRKIISKIKGEDYAKMDSKMGLGYINEYILYFGENSTFTTLRPNLFNTSIDDIISHIPSEKGYNFLYYIETLIGTNVMEIFIKNYFQHFKYKSINLEKFKDYFIEVCLSNDVSQENLDKINWDEWIYKPGKCPKNNDFSNNYDNQTNEVYENFINGNYNIVKNFTNLNTNSKIVFLQKLFSRESKLNYEDKDYLTFSLGLYKSNFLIKANYFKLILKKYVYNYYPSDYPKISDFLYNNTAIDYVNGIYFYLYKRSDISAEEILNNLKDFYHPVAFDFYEKEIKKAKEEYPILYLELKKKITCLYYKDKIEIKANGYEDFLGNIEIKNHIYLEEGHYSYGVKLNCYINSTDKYCLINGDDFYSKLYKLMVFNKIEQDNYAIKDLVGSNQIELYENIIQVDKNRTKNYYELMFGGAWDSYKIPVYFITYGRSVKVLLDNEELRYREENDDAMIEIYIERSMFGYDYRKKGKYQKYEVKIIGECGIEKYSLIIKIKGPPDLDDSIGIKISFWLIVSTSIAIFLIIGGIVFLFCLPNKKKRLLFYSNLKAFQKNN